MAGYEMTVWDNEKQGYSPMRKVEDPNLNRLIETLNVHRIKMTLYDGSVIVLNKGQNVDTYT